MGLKINIVHKRNNFRWIYCQECKDRRWMSRWWSCKSCYGLCIYISICSSVEESAQSGKFSGNLAHDFIPCILHLFVSLYAPPPSPPPGATLERDTICLQTPHWAHAGAALTTHFLPCLWHINCSLLYCTMCTVLYCVLYSRWSSCPWLGTPWLAASRAAWTGKTRADPDHTKYL